MIKKNKILAKQYIKGFIKKHDKIIIGLKKSKTMGQLIDKYVNINNELHDLLINI